MSLQVYRSHLKNRRKRIMDKYGVVTEEGDLTKQGSTDERCPNCGGKIEVHGKVKMCPRCGTKPFEGKDGQKAGKERR